MAEEYEPLEGSAPAPPRKPPPLRQTLENHFSNESLQQDRYLLQLIRDSDDGWIDLDTILTLKRVKAMRASREQVLAALRASWLETYEDSGYVAVRRPSSRGPLPRFQAAPAKAGNVKRPAPPTYDEEGVVAADVTTQQKWGVAAAPLKRPAPGGVADEAAAKKPRTETSESSGLAAMVRGTAREGRFFGRVKSFNLRLSMGKISCSEVGRDVAVALMDLAGFDVGDYVSFELTVDPDLGTPKAKFLKLQENAQADGDDEDAADGVGKQDDQEVAPAKPVRAAPPRPAAKVGGAKAAAPPVRKPAPARKALNPEPEEEDWDESAPPPAAAPQPGDPGVRVTGVIQTMDEANDVATVVCATTGNFFEVFASNLAGFEEGDSVAFTTTSTGEALEVEAA